MCDSCTMHQIKQFANLRHTDLEIFSVCPECDRYVFSSEDERVCGRHECQHPRPKRNRQFVLVNIVEKLQRMYAIPEVASQLNYSAQRGEDNYPGDVWDTDDALKAKPKALRRQTQ